MCRKKFNQICYSLKGGEERREKRWMHESEDEENVAVKDSNLDISLLNDSLKGASGEERKGE